MANTKQELQREPESSIDTSGNSGVEFNWGGYLQHAGEDNTLNLLVAGFHALQRRVKELFPKPSTELPHMDADQLVVVTVTPDLQRAMGHDLGHQQAKLNNRDRRRKILIGGAAVVAEQVVSACAPFIPAVGEKSTSQPEATEVPTTDTMTIIEGDEVFRKNLVPKKVFDDLAAQLRLQLNKEPALTADLAVFTPLVYQHNGHEYYPFMHIEQLGPDAKTELLAIVYESEGAIVVEALHRYEYKDHFSLVLEIDPKTQKALNPPYEVIIFPITLEKFNKLSSAEKAKFKPYLNPYPGSAWGMNGNLAESNVYPISSQGIYQLATIEAPTPTVEASPAPQATATATAKVEPTKEVEKLPEQLRIEDGVVQRYDSKNKKYVPVTEKVEGDYGAVKDQPVEADQVILDEKLGLAMALANGLPVAVANITNGEMVPVLSREEARQVYNRTYIDKVEPRFVMRGSHYWEWQKDEQAFAEKPFPAEMWNEKNMFRLWFGGDDDNELVKIEEYIEKKDEKNQSMVPQEITLNGNGYQKVEDPRFLAVWERDNADGTKDRLYMGKRFHAICTMSDKGRYHFLMDVAFGLKWDLSQVKIAQLDALKDSTISKINNTPEAENKGTYIHESDTTQFYYYLIDKVGHLELVDDLGGIVGDFNGAWFNLDRYYGYTKNNIDCGFVEYPISLDYSFKNFSEAQFALYSTFMAAVSDTVTRPVTNKDNSYVNVLSSLINGVKVGFVPLT